MSSENRISQCHSAKGGDFLDLLDVYQDPSRVSTCNSWSNGGLLRRIDWGTKPSVSFQGSSGDRVLLYPGFRLVRGMMPMHLTAKPRGITRVSTARMRGRELHTPGEGFRKRHWYRSVADARCCLLFSQQAISPHVNHGIPTSWSFSNFRSVFVT